MPRRKGLPSRGAASPLAQVMDSLTDPGTSDTGVTSDNSVVLGSEDVSGAAVATGTSDNRDTAGTLDTPRGRPVVKRPVPRDHVKLRRDLANEMRDAVWFFAEHGRPRVQLGELLDEAIAAWLAETKKRFNDGAEFPQKGRLR
jgi:hypothetical protein